jgi:hypothetical protein
MMQSKAFWFVAGLAAYWAVQHFTGVGKTGKAG